MTCPLKTNNSKKGFTLVEIMVSVTIFSFVMLMVASMLLSIVSADIKAQTLKATLDNLNVALDEMSRTIRTGVDYSTPDSCNTSEDGTPNCFSFTDQQMDTETFGFSNSTSVCGATTMGCITRTITPLDGPAGPTVALTGTDVNVGDLGFVLKNAGNPDEQPYVIVLVQGTSGNANKRSTNSTFNIETTISQRGFGG